MKMLFEAKRNLEIEAINREVDGNPDFVSLSEAAYENRVSEAVRRVVESGCRIVMLSGPSGSGKTTSSLKLAKGLREAGHPAEVISLDDFFKNIENYPVRPDGKKDYESVYAVDIDHVNDKLYELVRFGHAEIPQFDFPNQRRKAETRLVELGGDGVAVIEGIHALNPLLTDSINHSQAFRIYAGLREEYYEGDRRVIATRDLRITRRMIRDFYFRGHSVQRTLEMWDSLLEGEETWVKIFKPEADMLLDTSFSYEACVFRPILERLLADESQGGEMRASFEALVARFSVLHPVDERAVPECSMLREFLGGLVL